MHHRTATLLLLTTFCLASSARATPPAPSSPGPPNLLLNGGFETISAGLPTAWDYLQGDGPANLASSEVSPFHPGTTSVSLTDMATTYFPRLDQTFEPWVEDVVLSFDFRLVGAPLSSEPSWTVYPTSSSGAVPFAVVLHATGTQHQLTVTGGGHDYNLPIDAELWYELQIEVDQANQMTTGTLKSAAGLTAMWANLPFSNAAATDVRGIVISDSELARSNSIYFDNFQMRPVPEPRGIALLLTLVAFTFVASHGRGLLSHISQRSC